MMKRLSFLLAPLLLVWLLAASCDAVATKNPKKQPAKRTPARATQHPSLGNGHAYSQDMRQVTVFLRGNGQLRLHPIQAARVIRLFPSLRTSSRWIARHKHYCRYVRQGNIRATVLRGRQAFHLAFYRILYPKATAAEINTYLYHTCGGVRLFDPSQISRAEDRLGLSRKRGSTTARQALDPRNIQIRWNYWNLPYPFGISDVRRSDLIDLDEAGVFVESANRGSGKAYINCRVREPGPYGHSTKLNVLMAVSGEEPPPGQPAPRWLEVWTGGGTTITRFLAFICNILQDIGPGTPVRRRVFIMDNLNTHR
jgi:hypothetical protein